MKNRDLELSNNLRYKMAKPKQRIAKKKSSAYTLTVWSLIIAATAVGPVWYAAIRSENDRRVQSLATKDMQILLPESRIREKVTINNGAWEPAIHGYTHRLEASYILESLISIKAYAFIYMDQKQGKEMINTTNRLISNNDSQWRIAAQKNYSITLIEDGRSVTLDTLTIRSDKETLTVRRWYNINGEIVNSPIQAKLIELGHQMFLNNVISTHYILVSDSNDEQSNAGLDDIARYIIESDTLGQ